MHKASTSETVYLGVIPVWIEPKTVKTDIQSGIHSFPP